MSLCPAARVWIALDIFSSFRREAAAAALLFAGGWSRRGSRESRAAAPASNSSGSLSQVTFLSCKIGALISIGLYWDAEEQ